MDILSLYNVDRRSATFTSSSLGISLSPIPEGYPSSYHSIYNDSSHIRFHPYECSYVHTHVAEHILPHMRVRTWLRSYTPHTFQSSDSWMSAVCRPFMLSLPHCVVRGVERLLNVVNSFAIPSTSAPHGSLLPSLDPLSAASSLSAHPSLSKHFISPRAEEHSYVGNVPIIWANRPVPNVNRFISVLFRARTQECLYLRGIIWRILTL